MPETWSHFPNQFVFHYTPQWFHFFSTPLKYLTHLHFNAFNSQQKTFKEEIEITIWNFPNLPSLYFQTKFCICSVFHLFSLTEGNALLCSHPFCVHMDHTFSLAAAAKSLQSYLTLCDPRDGSPPGSPVPGILQARTLEWVVISFSNAWKWKVKVKSLMCPTLATPWTAAYQAPPFMGFSRQEYWSGLPLPSPLQSRVTHIKDYTHHFSDIFFVSFTMSWVFDFLQGARCSQISNSGNPLRWHQSWFPTGTIVYKTKSDGMYVINLKRTEESPAACTTWVMPASYPPGILASKLCWSLLLPLGPLLSLAALFLEPSVTRSRQASQSHRCRSHPIPELNSSLSQMRLNMNPPTTALCDTDSPVHHGGITIIAGTTRETTPKSAVVDAGCRSSAHVQHHP